MALNRVADKVAMFHRPHLLRQPAFKLLDTVSEEAAEIQILAVASCLEAMCRGTNQDSHEIISRVRKAMRDQDGPFNKEMNAITEYAKGELRGK